MKTLIVLSLVLFNSFVLFAQNNNLDTCLYRDTTILYLEIDELPKFQSDTYSSAMEYIYSNIKFPWQIDAFGTVIVSFVITRYGEIEEIKIERSLFEICDDEVKKVLLSMPKWKAGKKDGNFVNTLLFLPIRFFLN